MACDVYMETPELKTNFNRNREQIEDCHITTVNNALYIQRSDFVHLRPRKHIQNQQ